MPIYEYICLECGKIYDEISNTITEEGECPSCGHMKRDKLMSSPSTLSTKSKTHSPHGGTGCCGSSPSSKGCVPGSCCGKA